MTMVSRGGMGKYPVITQRGSEGLEDRKDQADITVLDQGVRSDCKEMRHGFLTLKQTESSLENEF